MLTVAVDPSDPIQFAAHSQAFVPSERANALARLCGMFMFHL